MLELWFFQGSRVSLGRAGVARGGGVWSGRVWGAGSVGGERSFGGVDVDFAGAIGFLEWAAFLERSRGGFADRMVAGRAVGPGLCAVTFGTPCTYHVHSQ